MTTWHNIIIISFFFSLLPLISIFFGLFNAGSLRWLVVEEEDKRIGGKRKGERKNKRHVIVHMACHVDKTTVKRPFGSG
jgi:hypothetical protein